MGFACAIFKEIQIFMSHKLASEKHRDGEDVGMKYELLPGIAFSNCEIFKMFQPIIYAGCLGYILSNSIWSSRGRFPQGWKRNATWRKALTAVWENKKKQKKNGPASCSWGSSCLLWGFNSYALLILNWGNVFGGHTLTHRWMDETFPKW